MLKEKLAEIRQDIIATFVAELQEDCTEIDDYDLFDVVEDNIDRINDLLAQKVSAIGIDAQTYIAYFKKNMDKNVFVEFVNMVAPDKLYDQLVCAYDGTEAVSEDLFKYLEEMFILSLKLDIDGNLDTYFNSLVDGIYTKYRKERSS